MLERAAECGALVTLEKPIKAKQIQDLVEDIISGRLKTGWDDASTS